MRDDWRGDPSVNFDDLPRSPMKTVEQLGLAGALLTHYKEMFKERYGDEPILDMYSDKDVSQWLAKTFNVNHAKDLIRHYFAMNTRWFCENAHSLPVLKKSINQVIASHSLSKKTSGGSGGIKLADPADTFHWYLLNSDMVRTAQGVTMREGKLYDTEGNEVTGLYERKQREPLAPRGPVARSID